MERSLAGVLLIAVVASSVGFFLMSGGSSEPISILDVTVPSSMFFSEQEYHAVVSLVARRDVEVEIRPHWLASVSRDELRDIQNRFGGRSIDVSIGEVEDFFSEIGILKNLTRGIGVKPELVDFRFKRRGEPLRLIFLSVASAQGLFMPEKIGRRRRVRPEAVGDYAVLMNKTGMIAGFYKGFQSAFYAPEQTLKYVEFDIDGNRTIYSNTSRPLLADLPLVGLFHFSILKGQRLDMIISIDGRGLRRWRPSLCVMEIWANGERVLFRPFKIS